jgi:hypothetical protein
MFYGLWDRVIRVLSGYNPHRFTEILTWPLRDALLAYEQHLREEARKEYRTALQVYASLAPYSNKKLKPPTLPKILEVD